MIKSLPKPAIVAAAIVGALLLVGVALKASGGEPPAKAPIASPYTHVGDMPKDPGAGVNSLTGEPLPDTAKDYEVQSHQLRTGPPPTGHP